MSLTIMGASPVELRCIWIAPSLQDNPSTSVGLYSMQFQFSQVRNKSQQ